MILTACVGGVASALEWLGRWIVALPVWLGRLIARPRRAVAAAAIQARSGGAIERGRELTIASGRERRGEITGAFARIAARHVSARSSRRLLVIAVLVILAVLAARAEAGPRSVVPPAITGDSCDDEGCGDEVLADAIPPVVSGTREQTTARELPIGDACDCASALPVPVSAVAAAAIRAAGLDDDPVPAWNKRARLAGLVPTISARAGRNLTWREIDDPTLGYTTMIDVRATWHLERLMFDPNELRISSIDVSRRREKRRVEMLATHAYAAWLATERGSGRAALLAADLDAITDGWFSTAIATAAKPPSAGGDGGP